MIRRAGASLRAGILIVGFLPLLWAAATEGDGGARSTGAGPTAAGAATPDFSTEILPLLTRIGCNNGQCHGASGRKAGFALSLRGYDPDSDFDALVRERSGRRIDVADPDKSLILRKPSLQIPHKGVASCRARARPTTPCAGGSTRGRPATRADRAPSSRWRWNPRKSSPRRIPRKNCASARG